VAQFWFIQKVRGALIERHPETFLTIEQSSIFPYRGLQRFTRGGRYKALKDAELNRHVRNLKRLNIIAVASWLAYGIAIFTAPIS
jgi:hypothetical protein